VSHRVPWHGWLAARAVDEDSQMTVKGRRGPAPPRYGLLFLLDPSESAARFSS